MVVNLIKEMYTSLKIFISFNAKVCHIYETSTIKMLKTNESIVLSNFDYTLHLERFQNQLNCIEKLWYTKLYNYDNIP